MFQAVTLYTNKLKDLRRFYLNLLGLQISTPYKHAFSLKIGSSELIFKESQEACFYHFAINIPGNQFSVLKDQIKERIGLNREGGRDHVYFPSFDADSMYFEDPAGNIVELIGRRKTDLFGQPSFSEAFLSISEIGLVTPYMEEISEKLQDMGLPLQGKNLEPTSVNFFGQGDSFIVLVAPERRWYFSNQLSQVFPLEITLKTGDRLKVNKQGLLDTFKK